MARRPPSTATSPRMFGPSSARRAARIAPPRASSSRRSPLFPPRRGGWLLAKRGAGGGVPRPTRPAAVAARRPPLRGGKARDLPPRHAHVAGERRATVAAIDDEIVPLGLARDRLVDRGVERVVALGGPQRRAEIRGILLAETHVERARAGHAHPVAGFAEIVGERGDEAEPAAGLLDPHVARRSAGAVVDVLERIALAKPRAHHRERQILLEPALAHVAERHD